jgi:hypothetical protein
MSDKVLVIVRENGTERYLLTDSYIVDETTVPDVALETVNQHIAALNNPHGTSLQQAVSKQGSTPINGEIQIGTTNNNDELLRILKSMIVVALNGDPRTTSMDANGFHHTNHNGLYLDMDNGGVHLYSGNNTISVNYDGTITGLLDSPLANSAVTKAYVDTLALGLKPHKPVRVMLQKGTDVNAFYNNGSGVGKTITASGNGIFQFQGLSFSIGDRIGLTCYGYQRIDAGIYTITNMGSASTPWVLTRATDFDGSPSSESKQADVLFVQEGTYAKYMFIETERGNEPNSGNLIIDSDLVTWEIFHKPQDFVFDQGLQLNGQIVSVKPDNTTGDTIIPVTVSPNGVGVQKSIITDIAEAKKVEAKTYADSLKTQSDQALQTTFAQTQTNDQAVQTAAKSYTDSQIQTVNTGISQAKADAILQSETFASGLKTQSDQALQTTYQQTQTNDQTVQTAAKNYTDSAIQGVNQQITTLVASIPTGSGSKPMIYPQFFLLNGGTIQNYSDYLYMDNAYRSGNDGGLNSNNCIPFLVPEAATLIGVSIYVGAVAVAGNYVANTNASVNFELRQMVAGGTNTICPFSINVNGSTSQIGSNGNFSATPQTFAGGIVGLSVALTKSYLLGIKFINNTTGSAVIASAIKNVVIKLEIRVG